MPLKDGLLGLMVSESGDFGRLRASALSRMVRRGQFDSQLDELSRDRRKVVSDAVSARRTVLSRQHLGGSRR